MLPAIEAPRIDQALPQFSYHPAISCCCGDGENAMWGAMMLMAQAISAAPPPPRAIGPELPQLSRIVAKCAPSTEGDIVVCGKTDSEQYRLRPLGPPPNGKPLPPATIRIGSGTADVRAVQRPVPPGGSAPAAMVTLKLPF